MFWSGQNPPSKFALWAPYGALLDAAGDRDIKQLNFKIAHQLVVDRTISVLRAKGKTTDAATVKVLAEKAKASHLPGSEAFATFVTSYWREARLDSQIEKHVCWNTGSFSLCK